MISFVPPSSMYTVDPSRCTADVLVGTQLVRRPRRHTACTANVLVGMPLCTANVFVGMPLCTANVFVGMQLVPPPSPSACHCVPIWSAGGSPAPERYKSVEVLVTR